MEISQEQEGGIVYITIKGRLDADSAQEAEKTVNEALGSETTKLLPVLKTFLAIDASVMYLQCKYTRSIAMIRDIVNLMAWG